MKLIIQIPCYNEAQTLPATLADIPAHMPGVDTIEILIIDDGSTDNTVEVARKHGAHHVVQLPGHKGLGPAFQAGLEACLKLGADVIVNTDGDNEHPQREIPRLIEPILLGQADMVIGARKLTKIPHFSPFKKFLQVLGNWIVRIASGTKVPDATCGFRALSRSAAMQLAVMTRYSYTLETVVQAGKKSLRVAWLPIDVNMPVRKSRLMRSCLGFVRRQGATVAKLYVLYEPLKTFFYLSLPFFLLGMGLLVRFGILWLMGDSGVGRHVQSLIVATIAIVIAFLLNVVGVIGDLIAANRARLEEIMYRIKRMEYEQKANASLDSAWDIDTDLLRHR